jgi:hypothetical protein
VRRLVGRVRTQRGVALSSPVALLSVGAVVLAGAAFVATSGHDEEPTRPAAAAPAVTTPAATPTSTAPTPAVTKPKPKKKPPVRRGGTYVEVYNNSGISGPGGRLGGRRLGQLVRHHPGQHRLLPGAAARPGQAARQGPRHLPAQAVHRPDARRPAHRDPHQRLLLTPGRPPRPGCVDQVLAVASVVRRGASQGGGAKAMRSIVE